MCWRCTDTFAPLGQSAAGRPVAMQKSGSTRALGDALAAPPLAAGWLRTKGRDSAVTSLQQMKAWVLWYTVLSREASGVYRLRCFADEAATQLKARHPSGGCSTCGWRGAPLGGPQSAFSLVLRRRVLSALFQLLSRDPPPRAPPRACALRPSRTSARPASTPCRGVSPAH